jgi:hypothetical protein
MTRVYRMTILAAFALASSGTVVAQPAAPPAAAEAPTTTPAPLPTPTKADRSQEIVCRKDKVIGSLVATKKTCHSRAQWAYIDDTNQAFSRELADFTRTKPAGN